ncbi:uncharacterized protein LOC110100280 [Dendrobium catenatum]|uniref:uncharacterized protein LOC110100280 n=1 Tax=Dendrobium catenatum TaxID=906689 RepID=UPI0010A08195|nr:uncharacterized protein LOC110100280 [Dendrobium catenatum]
MRPFGQPDARQIARAPARPIPVLAQPVCTMARRPVPRPHPVPLRAAVRRPAPASPVAQVAPAPLRRQPAAVVPPVRAAVRRPAPAAPVAQAAPASQRRQPAAVVTPVVPVEVPRIQIPALSVVPIPPATQAVGSDVPSTSTSGLG